jgi:ATP-binding cassette subfamily B protein
MLRSARVGHRFVWLSDYARDAERRVVPASPVALPDRLCEGIVFDHVSFRYPGTDVDVLHDVNVRLAAGTTVAMVGDNGAGKSTLIKLLCRFYEPTTGRILVDGVPLADVDPVAWRARMAAGFQDFAQLELVARTAVGVGDLPCVDDSTAVTSALERASALDVVDDLPSGLDQQLGRTFEGGVELSGGQWQKVALGRAMMREHPLLLLLDEPTSALDPQTEHALFERYAGAARRVGTQVGAITVLVSHRFSTVRMADEIIVVNDGRIEEHGTHDALIANAGLYAELYELQARAYR